MKKNILKLISGATATGVLLMVSASNVFAQDAAIDTCPESAPAALCDLTFFSVLPQVLNILMFAAFVAALVFLIYGGIRWVLSGGDKEGTSKAKGTVTAALIGLAIVLSSWLLVNIVLNLFGITEWKVENLLGTAVTEPAPEEGE